ncbi:MAG TPA: NADP-dependent malic enzyme [Phycisphaerae bacterium]|nr:NADP-dependent malic enzyme [Phycisphaerae bacterium]HNU45135.1 NADP-dependent malic enzyme [Phycisphaerae bacterium]
MALEADARLYHAQPRPGKIEVVPTKPCITQRDLSLAYTPGVAVPCLDIQKDPYKAYEYTSRGNLVAVISNGTAVLGLGNIGALAGKPVMEGKGVLFKRFAGIDVFDLEVDTLDPDEFINIVQKLGPTFGGINLEDIKAPECFYIEQRLQELMDIPVFHDDQHGTAIISGAALINGCIVQKKELGKIRMVISGAGAAGIACAKFYESLGVKHDHIMLVDSKGVIYKGRSEGMNEYKEHFAVQTKARTLADALKGADVFSGLSQPGIVTQEMVKSMADKPLICAMANPVPEIMPEEARAARSDAIVASGRSDYPNQVNNVLGFPFIFRGALDVRARKINEEMKLAACHALAELARQDVPDSVLRAYGLKRLHFGPDYIIPKPFDPRVLTWESSAVAEAAVKSGVAQAPIQDFRAYRDRLEASLSRSQQFMRALRNRARGSGKRIIFSDGDHPTILRAVSIIEDEQLARPVLVGRPELIQRQAREMGIHLRDVEIVDPYTHPERDLLIQHFYDKRKRKGINWTDATFAIRRPDWFAALMLDMGKVDGMVGGIGRTHTWVMRSLLEVIPRRPDVKRVSGMFIVLTKADVLFFADCTAQIEPNAEQLAETALLTARVARYFGVTPKVAMLSFSNFGSVRHPATEKLRQAVDIVRQREPALCIDGEMQADTALSKELQDNLFPFCELKGPANVLIFPNLAAGLIASKLMTRLGNAEMIGPLALGAAKPINVLQLASDVENVVNATAITVIECIDGTL